MTAYFDPIEYINRPRWRAMSLGLERMRLLLERLSHPESHLRFVHVAGTNGKGSVCSYLASIMQASGYVCGLFTSPYIERFEERIQINGAVIAHEDLVDVTLMVAEAAEWVEEATGEHPTEFELMCAVALVYFERSACDIVIMEVGLGGRLDATNVITPLLSVITKIGLDHCALLGNTLSEIAYEKAGIIKAGVSVVALGQSDEVMDVIAKRCAEEHAALYLVDVDRIEACGLDAREGTLAFCYREERWQTRMIGRYQIENASVAIEAARVLSNVMDVPDRAIEEGIAHAQWPGRFEIIGTSPQIIVDGAHNPQGVIALRDSLRYLMDQRSLSPDDPSVEARPHQRFTFVMGVLADKDYENMIEPLLDMAQRFVVYTPDNPRALRSDMLAHAIEGCVRDSKVSFPIDIVEVSDAADAIRTARELTGPEGTIVAFGTLYAISDIRSAVKRLW